MVVPRIIAVQTGLAPPCRDISEDAKADIIVPRCARQPGHSFALNRRSVSIANIEYYPNAFLDLSGELVTGLTKQTRDEDSFEATVRLGVRLHLLNQIFNSPVFDKVRSERFSGRRFTIANLARIEARNFWYSGGRASESDLRFRDRIETKLALNKPTLTDDGVWYASADIERFVPIGSNDIAERFATKRRLRIGVGFRQSYRWRFELLAMADRARETIDEEADVDAYMLDFRVKRYF